MEYFWLSAVILFAVFGKSVQVIRYWRRNRLLHYMPGPKPIPVLGNMLLFSGGRDKLLSTFINLREKYGETFLTWHGSRPVINLCAPKEVEKILGANNMHIRKGKAYDFLLPWLGTGLLTSWGTKWFSHRKLITPTFHFKILEGFVEVFNENAQTMVKSLAHKADGEYFNICPDVTLCALDIICETAMGTKINAMENASSPYVSATLKISKLSVDRVFTLWHHPDNLYFNTQVGKQYTETLSIMHNFTEQVIEDRKEMRKTNDAEKTESDITGAKKRLAFLDLLLDSADSNSVPLTNTEIREEVDTFMFEGHDTTTMAIAWTLLLLGNHMDIQTSVRAELNTIFQGEERTITLRDLGEMKLLERVIKEALRLYPSVPSITRIIDEDIILDGYMIPAKTDVAIHIFNMHRNPNVFENPLKFDPDRFLPDKSHDRHPYAYLPFSAGQRNCIGQKFAMYEEKVVLASILQKFEVISKHRSEDIIVSQELVCRPQIGVFVKLLPISDS